MPEVYSDIALDHFRNPRNVGVLEYPDRVGVAENPVTGATLEIQLRLDGGVVVEAKFRAQGCTATIAAGSMLTELLLGRSVEALAIPANEIEAALGGLPPTRRHAARLAADASASAHRSMGIPLRGGSNHEEDEGRGPSGALPFLFL